MFTIIIKKLLVVLCVILIAAITTTTLRVETVDALSLFGSTTTSSSSSTNIRKIQVCQNKDCYQRWKGLSGTLPETIQDLLGSNIVDVDIETSGCLSYCGKGPNICMTTTCSTNNNINEIFVNGLIDPNAIEINIINAINTDTNAVVDEDMNNNDPKTIIPSKLLAAVTCMERAQKAASNDYEEKERYLSSVIRALGNDGQFNYTTAHARSRILRGSMFLERKQSNNNNEELVQMALLDFQHAVNIIQKISQVRFEQQPHHHHQNTNNPLLSMLLARAYRLQSDAYTHMNQYELAIESLRKGAQACPAMENKLLSEMRQLKSKYL